MNIEMIHIMLPAFVACLVLVGIHSYLGIHVIKRKVIFVDLALAQIAALGTTFAFLFGIDPSSSDAYWFSLGFTIIGAAIFSLSRIRHEKIPQEAVIGLVYALAAAAAIIVVDRAPHGAEHIKEIMTGSILWVKWKTILSAALVYAGVGLFHFFFREKFLLISNHPELAYQKKMNVRFWDFLFYVSFGVVITHSVNTAGVLLVFVFLVVPAIATIMITDKLWLQLVLGWSMGTLVSVLGLYTSYLADLPSGPTVVVMYGLVLLTTTLFIYVFRSPAKMQAIKNIALGTMVLILAVSFFWMMGKMFRPAHPGEGGDEQFAVHPHHQHIPVEEMAQAMTEDQFKQIMSRQPPLQKLIELYDHLEKPSQKLEIARRIFQMDPGQGCRRITNFLGTDAPPFLRQKALETLYESAGTDFGYDALLSPQENQQAIEKWKKWCENQY